VNIIDRNSILHDMGNVAATYLYFTFYNKNFVVAISFPFSFFLCIANLLSGTKKTFVILILMHNFI
jgi:hypothetical protein